MANKAKTQQKRWHLYGVLEVTDGQGGSDGDKRPSTFLGNYNEDNSVSLALVAYTGSYYDLIDYPDLENYIVDGNYVHTDNNFTDEDKSKLGNLFNYVLPIATRDVLGGIKVGDHLEMRADPDIELPRDEDKVRLSVIESHFIYVQPKPLAVSRHSEIPDNTTGSLELYPGFSPTGENAKGHYIKYNNMTFFSQDVKVDEKEVNIKTGKITQQYLERGGLWWTTAGSDQWIKVLDQFNIISFNKRVGNVMPVGMDDLKTVCEDYTADMVAAVARLAFPGGYSKKKGAWDGVGLDAIEDNSASWARIGSLPENGQYDYTNSPTGRPMTGHYWKLVGLPTLPTYDPKTGYPNTYRGLNDGAFFIIPTNEDKIWVKRGGKDKWDKNDWFYLEQLPIATRSRLGGVIVGSGLDITETGVLSVSGIVTSWTGKQGNRRVNEVVAMTGDYDATMITFGTAWSNTANVDYELRRLQTQKAPINSPAFMGSPTTPTPPNPDSSEKIANTRWVTQYVTNSIRDITSYTLPKATTSSLGGIIVGDGLSVDGNGRLSVNTTGGGGDIVVDTSPNTTSSNPISNAAITIYVDNLENRINQKFTGYVLKESGTANNLKLTGNAEYKTLPSGTSNDYLASTKFVMDAIDNKISTIGGGVTINPYVLPPATNSQRGGVRVDGDHGIYITNTDLICLDAPYINSLDLDYISSKNRIGDNNSTKKWSDIPDNSSGVVTLSALYSPTATDLTGYYLKYNSVNSGGGVDSSSYILWFCDLQTNDSYYLVHPGSDDAAAWSKTFSLSGGNLMDFDISQYAKLDSPLFINNPMAPTPDYPDSSLRIANTQYVTTAINRSMTDLPKASTSEFGVVKIGNGIRVAAGVISMDGVVSFNGRSGDVTPGNNDYNAPMIKYDGRASGSTVKAALDSLADTKAGLASPNFSGIPTISNSPIATENYVRQWQPIASTSSLGMIKVGSGLEIDAQGVLTLSGAVSGWTGNQGTRQSGEVIAAAGDYNSNMIYYDPQDGSKTVRSELDLKAYDDSVIHRDDGNVSSWQSAPTYTAGMFNTGTDYRNNGAFIKLPYTSGSGGFDAALIIKSDDGIGAVGAVNRGTMNVYVSGEYGNNPRNWSALTRLLTTRDLDSTPLTGTPTINGNPIQILRVADNDLGSVKNGGNIVVDSEGKMNYTLPIASSSVLGGVKIGSGISVDANGVISTSGSVTSFNGRAGDIVPVGDEQDYNADMVGAIKREKCLNVSSFSDIPFDSAGYVKFPAPSDWSYPEVEGSYVALGNLSSSTSLKDVLLIRHQKRVWQYYNGQWSHGKQIANLHEVLYSSGRQWARVDGLGVNYDTDNSYGIGPNTIDNQTSYNNDLKMAYASNRAGILRTSIERNGLTSGTNNTDWIATFLNIESDPYYCSPQSGSLSGSFYGIQYSLTISAFYNRTDGSKLQGLYYNRADGIRATNASNATNKSWIKLVDTENIYDYVADTSNLYNTENYTDSEIDAEITTTLAELNA